MTSDSYCSRCPWTILGFEPHSNPTVGQIKSARVKALLRYHPDKKNSYDSEAPSWPDLTEDQRTSFTKLVNAAYEVLLDRDLRNAYMEGQWEQVAIVKQQKINESFRRDSEIVELIDLTYDSDYEYEEFNPNVEPTPSDKEEEDEDRKRRNLLEKIIRDRENENTRKVSIENAELKKIIEETNLIKRELERKVIQLERENNIFASEKSSSESQIRGLTCQVNTLKESMRVMEIELDTTKTALKNLRNVPTTVQSDSEILTAELKMKITGVDERGQPDTREKEMVEREKLPDEEHVITKKACSSQGDGPRIHASPDLYPKSNAASGPTHPDNIYHVSQSGNNKSLLQIETAASTSAPARQDVCRKTKRRVVTSSSAYSGRAKKMPKINAPMELTAGKCSSINESFAVIKSPTDKISNSEGSSGDIKLTNGLSISGEDYKLIINRASCSNASAVYPRWLARSLMHYFVGTENEEFWGKSSVNVESKSKLAEIRDSIHRFVLIETGFATKRVLEDYCCQKRKYIKEKAERKAKQNICSKCNRSCKNFTDRQNHEKKCRKKQAISHSSIIQTRVAINKKKALKREACIDKIRGSYQNGLEMRVVASKSRSVFTKRKFQGNEFVCVYPGALISAKEAVDRELHYASTGQGNFMYFFTFGSKKLCYDATEESSHIGRLINHSRTTPNISARIQEVDTVPHIVFFTTRVVERGEELLYDYADVRSVSKKTFPWLKT